MADLKTIQEYSSNSKKFISDYESKAPQKLYELASIYFKPNGETIDIGAGTGRDASQLNEMGFNTIAVEPVDEFCAFIKSKRPHIKCKKDQLPELEHLKGHSVDNIFCCAVLSHLPSNELLSSLYRLLEILREDGCLILSWRNSMLANEREGERLFSSFSGRQVMDILMSYGCETLYYRYDYPDESRPNIPFYTLVVKKKSKALRGLAKLQSIISNDSKSSTYKLALIRALAEIAQTENFCVKYESNSVLVPLNKISKLWVYYYWKLALDDVKQGTNTNLAIYNKLSPYAKRLQHPAKNYYSEGSTDKASIELEKLIEKTIIDQPVKYITENNVSVFSKSGDRLVVPEEVWRDLVLFGHWVEKSLLLEWAQMTYQLNKKQKSLGHYLDVLMYTYDGVRDSSVINDVRNAIMENGELKISKCCWSGTSLNSVNLAIDHMIPFSGGYIEHLWNLLPADKKVNGQKSDRIPTVDRISKSFDAISKCWRLYEAKFPERFAREFKEGLNLNVSDLGHSISKDALIERVTHQVNVRGGVYW
jgi:SAM-dependent methyltransferase